MPTPEETIREACGEAIAILSALHQGLSFDARSVYRDSTNPECLTVQLAWLLLAVLQLDEDEGGPTVGQALRSMGAVNANLA